MRLIRDFLATTHSEAVLTCSPPPMPVTSSWREEFIETLIHFGYSRGESHSTFRELTAYIPEGDVFWKQDAGEAAEIVCSGYYGKAPGVFSRRWLIIQSGLILAFGGAILYFITN